MCTSSQGCTQQRECTRQPEHKQAQWARGHTGLQGHMRQRVYMQAVWRKHCKQQQECMQQVRQWRWVCTRLQECMQAVWSWL